MNFNSLNHNHSPNYLINAGCSDVDELALFIRDEIQNYAVTLIESDVVDEYYPDRQVSVKEDINGGHCEALCVYVYDKVKRSEYDESRIRLRGLEHIMQPQGVDPAIHFWIEYTTENGQCFHFDAETPWGVDDWRRLSVISRRERYIDEYACPVKSDPRKILSNEIRGFYGIDRTEDHIKTYNKYSD